MSDDATPAAWPNTGPGPRLADAPAHIRRRAPKIVVIGDFLLDGWWSGRINRLAREAPAPVVEMLEREYVPGGAANTAVNLAALGARVRAIGLVGDDDEGRMLRDRLRDTGVDVEGLLPVPGTRTTTKFRIVAGDQLMLRIDDGERGPWPASAVDDLVTAAVAATADADAEVICDYGSAALESRVIEALAGRQRRAALTVVDAHEPRRWRELGAHLVTPNAAEAARTLGRPMPEGADRASFVVENTAEILAVTGALAAVVTLDADGAVLVRYDDAPLVTHAHPALEKQASGAGDTFVAALTAGAASGLTLRTALDLAQAAADIVVQKPGTCVCSSEELERWLTGSPDITIDAVQLAERLAEHRQQGQRIVFTNGCFDVLHRGHTSYLRQAKQLGDVLVVAVNGDESVRRLKGPDRPINRSSDRANVLAALSCVDYVTVFDEDTPMELIRVLRPDVYAKGGDYTPEMLDETKVVEEVGGTVAILDYVPANSTTALVNRIRSGSGA